MSEDVPADDERAAYAAGFEAGLGRLEGFKEAVRLEIATRYLDRRPWDDNGRELAALRALVCRLMLMAEKR